MLCCMSFLYGALLERKPIHCADQATGTTNNGMKYEGELSVALRRLFVSKRIAHMEEITASFQMPDKQQ